MSKTAALLMLCVLGASPVFAQDDYKNLKEREKRGALYCPVLAPERLKTFDDALLGDIADQCAKNHPCMDKQKCADVHAEQQRRKK